MNQILEETYFKDPEKWQKIASQQGGLEICDNDTGQSIGVLKPNSIHIDYYPGVIPKNFHWNYTEEEIQTALDGFVSKSENGESKTKYTANQATQDLIRQAIIISHKLAISFGSPSDALKDIEDYDNKLQNSPEMHITSDEWELQNTTISLLWKITQIVLGGKSNKK